MSHQVRPMRRGDLARVEAIYRQLAHEIPPAEWLPVAEQALGDTSGPPLAWVAVAPGDRVIGYIIGAIRSWEFGSAPAGWIIAIGVDLEHRKERAGTDPRPPVCRRMRPMMDNAIIPKIRPISRMLSRMSPLRMWLNSWATTPCSSSRVK